MALAMQRRVGELADLWRAHGHDCDFRIRIGINTGEASVGDFGSAARKLYSGIGLQTNIAERIQAACRPGEILVSESTHELIGRSLHCEPMGPIAIKGLRAPLPVFRLWGAPAAARSAAADAATVHGDLARAPC
jgi:adenylate cyclase